ncbi:MAG TPA: hypothetical protein VLJ44_04565 [Gaiellaceae bacterium]|nr:hypothetical protein [Gaiellaceae bacterium]
MPERRGSRFVVEALFLAALTVALALAHLEVLEIVGAMALGWIVVAAIEWTAWRGEPHYGAGMPPRYYLPRVELPPPQPLEEVEQGYPDAGRDDAPTWIASASLRAEVLGEWPLFGPASQQPEEEEEPQFVEASVPGADPWTVAALPSPPLEESVHAVSVAMRSDARRAHYSLDPLGDPPRRRRLGRGSAGGAEIIEVLALPRERALPSSFSVASNPRD